MNKDNLLNQAFSQFLATQSVQIEIVNFIVNLILTAVLAFCLRVIYKKFGTAISNRSAFSGNFVLIATTTMLIIPVVKSSLAHSHSV